MPNNWKNIDFRKIAKDAAATTDDKLASQISSLTKFTDDEIKKLFPEKGDIAKFAELMNIVKSANTKNAKIRQIMENGEKFGGIVVTLLGKFI